MITGPTQPSFIQELLKDKNGIYIEGSNEIKHVKVGQQKKLTLWVLNKGTLPRILQKCHIPAESSQFLVESVKFLQEYTTMMKGGNRDVTDGSVTIYPAMSVYINITLNAR